MNNKIKYKKIIFLLFLIFFTGIINGVTIYKYKVGYIVIRDFIENNDVYFNKVEGKQFNLTTRYNVYPNNYVYENKKLDTSSTALVLIDVWENYPNKDFLVKINENIISCIVPLVSLARENNIIVIHSPHGFNKVSRYIIPLDGEFITVGIDSKSYKDSLDEYLKKKNITTLFYAGYDTDVCLLNRPTGIISMSNLGYDIILIRDCTLSSSGEQNKDSTIQYIEQLYGSTTTLNEVKNKMG